jgi:hypothetical protein
LIYPIDKTTLDPLRLAHFLALAYLAQRLVPAAAPFLRWPVAAPLRRCGEHSLLVFCLGTFLSFSAQVWIEAVGGSIAAQIAASVVGIALLTAAAYVAAWYKTGQGAGTSAAT